MNNIVLNSNVVRASVAVALLTLGPSLPNARAQVTFDTVTNALMDFYPLDNVDTNSGVTPDIIGGRDMILFGMGASNVVASTHPGGATTNCLNFPQTGLGTVIYYNSLGQNPLTGGGDFLPFCNQRGATMNFWIKGNGLTAGSDKRFFGEADTTGSAGNPLYLIGTSSGTADQGGHWLVRLQDSSGPGGSTIMSDGTYQLPVRGYYWTQGANFTSTTNPLLDNAWHMFTVEIDSNGVTFVYIDGIRDGGPGTIADPYGNSTCGPALDVTNIYYTTNIYPASGVSNPPPRGYVGWVLDGIFNRGSTAFGGFKRGGVSAGLPCQIDDIAFWSRQLSADEIMFVKTNGLPGPFVPNPFPKILSFKADVPEAGQGGTVGLHWQVTGAAMHVYIDNGVGEVTGQGLDASINVPLTANQTYTFTLTASNGIAQTQTKSVSVKVLHGVDSAWNLFQRFDGVYSPTTSGFNSPGFWVQTFNNYQGVNFDRWNVVSITNSGGVNEVLSPRTGYTPNASSDDGYEARGAMVYGSLNGLTIPPNQNTTLFFRFSLQEPPNNTGAILGTFHSDMDCAIGFSDYTFLAPLGTAAGVNFGPQFGISRFTGGNFTGGPINLTAGDYAGSGTSYVSNYSYRASVSDAGLATNSIYYVWMDVSNLNTMAVTNPDTSTFTTNEPLYSVWLQKQGDPTRTLLFSGFHGNRDYVAANPVVDIPTPYLNKVFFSIGDESLVSVQAGAYTSTNMIAVDDIYLSKSGFASTIPRLFDIRSIVMSGGNATITWDSLGSMYGTNTYSVQRTLSLTPASWTTLVSGLPSGGDTTSYTDTTLGGSSTAYYRIVWP